MSKSKLTYDLVEIGPEEAEQFVASMDGNRQYREKVARLYAGAMTRGEWMENGVPVLLDRKGRMLDGQHRMHAIMISGTTQLMLVVGGLDPRVQLTIDVGKARTMKDALDMHGELDTTNLAATLRRAWTFETYATWENSQGPAATHQELLRFLDRNPGLRDSLKWTGAEAMRAIPFPRSSLAAMAYELEQITGEGRAFITAVAEAKPASRGDAAAVLRQVLNEWGDLPPGQRVRPIRKAATFVRAFNLRGRSVTKKEITTPEGKGFPEVRS